MGKFHRLAPEERYQIEALLNSGQGIRQMARQLKRHASTISREVRKTQTRYQAQVSEQWTQALRRRAHPELQKIGGTLKQYVDQKIRLDWSPEQIAGRLHLKRKGKIVSHQTIYRYLQRDQALKGDLWKHLRILRRENKNKMPRSWKPTRLEGRTMIQERPSIVEDRKRLGDYERDTLMGKFNGPFLLTLVDRTSRLGKIAWIQRKCSDLIHVATVNHLRNEPVRTITNDNGTEFSRHAATAETLGAKVYFSRAYRAWERGTNENFNGLLRQYFPRRKGLEKVTQEKLKEVEDLLNHRPRKCLGYQTPFEVHQCLKRQALR